MRRTQFIIGILLAFMASRISGQLMPDVCKDVPVSTGHDDTNRRPTLSNQFWVEVECKLSERNATTYVKEYYDFPNNRGRMTLKKTHVSVDFYMDYSENLLLMVTPEDGKCVAGMLPLTEDKFVFGYKFNGVSSQMLSPSGALRFSSANETYVGRNHVRSIYVDEWHSCQYIDALNATAHVVWYFSRKEEWDMQMGLGTNPIRMTAVGKQGMPDGSVRSFDHTYDFFNFWSGSSPKDFEIRDGIYCPGREKLEHPKPFPQIPDNFYFVREFTNPYDKIYSAVVNRLQSVASMQENAGKMHAEAYDDVSKHSMYKYNSKFVGLSGRDRYTELNDYKTGVTYLVDSDEGSCKLLPIEAGPMAFGKHVDGNTVRMETPREFFMDKNITYQYAGLGYARNMLCDRWIGFTDHAMGAEGINVTVEWFFTVKAHDNWNDANSPYRIPVLLRVTLTNTNSLPYEFNIFNFNVNYYLHEVDLSPCYTLAQRKSVRFSIPHSNETVVRQNILQTTMAIQSRFSEQAGVSPLRITDVNFYFNPDKVLVTLDLLDRSPLFGGVVDYIPENSLEIAYKLIRYSFTHGIIKFPVVSGGKVLQVTPNYDSLEDMNQMSAQTSSDNYSAGAFAGLTIGMLIAGGAGGSVGGFLILNRR